VLRARSEAEAGSGELSLPAFIFLILAVLFFGNIVLALAIIAALIHFARQVGA